MNMDALSSVKFGDVDSLSEFLFENAMQHRLFAQVFAEAGVAVPQFPLFDANPDNLDDWLLAHQVEHQAYAGYLSLENPINLLDVDFDVREQFDDFLASHLYLHQQIVAQLGL